METLFDPATAQDVQRRIASLTAASPRQWGKMTPAQMAAHCSKYVEIAVGDTHPKQWWVGRLVGRIVKHFALRDESPMPHHVRTVPGYAVTDDRDFTKERDRLAALVDRFVRGGPAGCTTGPHVFFGRLTPEEWARLNYKHLDHHLRQFGV